MQSQSLSQERHDTADARKRGFWDYEESNYDHKRIRDFAFGHGVGHEDLILQAKYELPDESRKDAIIDQTWDFRKAIRLTSAPELSLPATTIYQSARGSSLVPDSNRQSLSISYDSGGEFPDSLEFPQTIHSEVQNPTASEHAFMTVNGGTYEVDRRILLPSLFQDSFLVEGSDPKAQNGHGLYKANASHWIDSEDALGTHEPTYPFAMEPNTLPTRIDGIDTDCFPVQVDTEATGSAFESGFEVERVPDQALSVIDDEMAGRFSPCTPEPGVTAVESSLPAMDISGPPPYEACFGVISVQATSLWKPALGIKEAPVSITIYGDMLRLSFKDSGKHAGIITSSALRALVEKDYVRLDAILLTPQDRPEQISRRKNVASEMSSTNHPVRILVYGLLSEKHTIGNLLSDAEIYLQHPAPSEYDRRVEYSNPQYLLRPGSHMPNLDQGSISSAHGSSTSSEVLNDAMKSQFMRMFDQAFVDGDSSLAEPSLRLRSSLHRHQLVALAMMKEKELGIIENPAFPSIWQNLSPSAGTIKYRHKITGSCEVSPLIGRGGIIADEMGLGKTLSFLALVCWSLDTSAERSDSSDNTATLTTLVIAPKSVISAWQDQVQKHIHPGALSLSVYHGSTRNSQHNVLSNHNIVLTTYETLRSEFATKGFLISKEWHRVALDEAHRIRSRSSQLFQAACAIKARHRWCLTGTPIHNSLDDYGALLNFVGVPPFTSKSLFDYWIAEPIRQGRPDSLRTLEELIRATCLRRKKTSAGSGTFDLPPRSDEVQWVELSPEDRDIYTFFKAKAANVASELSRNPTGEGKANRRRDTNVLTLINFLRLICDHGEHLLPQSALQIWEARTSNVTDWQATQAYRVRCQICRSHIDEATFASTQIQLACQHFTAICSTCAFRLQEPINPVALGCSSCTTRANNDGSLSIQRVPYRFTRPSAKIDALIQNLHRRHIARSEENRHELTKSVIFSAWTKMLDLVQHHLESRGFSLQRIDGQSSIPQRHQAISTFNEDPKCTIMLASIGSAAEGIDLIAANHVDLLEPHWNPMVEAQAVDRVHRIGQTREVFITRYLARDTIEDYVRWIQKDKIRIINQSLDCSADNTQAEIEEKRWKQFRKCLDALDVEGN